MPNPARYGPSLPFIRSSQAGNFQVLSEIYAYWLYIVQVGVVSSVGSGSNRIARPQLHFLQGPGFLNTPIETADRRPDGGMLTGR